MRSRVELRKVLTAAIFLLALSVLACENKETAGFKPEVRIWSLSQSDNRTTFYSKHGDVFVISCAVLSLLIFIFTFGGSVGKARNY